MGTEVPFSGAFTGCMQAIVQQLRLSVQEKGASPFIPFSTTYKAVILASLLLS